MKKKLLSLLLSIALILGAVSVPLAATASGYSYILGDADGNGEVESIDAVFVMRYCAMITVAIPYETLMQGDVDQNEELESVDATYIQRYLALMRTPYNIGDEIVVEEPTEPPTQLLQNLQQFLQSDPQSRSLPLYLSSLPIK